MGDDHYRLDIDPDGLKYAREWFAKLSDHLTTKGTSAAGVPGEIGDQWTGRAAEDIKAEMTGLGTVMKDPMASGLDSVVTAIQTLETRYRTALDEELPDLNRRWREADAAYDAAVAAADRSYDRATRTEPGEPPLNRAIREEMADARTGAVSDAADARATERARIDDDFNDLKDELRRKTKALGTALVTHTPVDVPPSALDAWQKHGQYPRYPLTGTDVLQHLGVTQQYVRAQEEQVKKDAEADVEELRALLDDREAYDSVELRERLASYSSLATDPLYAKYFALAGGADLVRDVYDAANADLALDSMLSPEDWEPALRGFNDLMAAGLAQVDDVELGEFAKDFDSEEYAPVLAALTGSEHADDRLRAVSLAYSYYMDPGHLHTPKYRESDIAQHMMFSVHGGKSYEEIVRTFIDASDPAMVARMVNNFTAATRDDFLWNLLANHEGPSPNGVRNREITEFVYRDLVPRLLTEARDGEYEETVEGLLKAVPDISTSMAAAQWPIDLGAFLKDPRTIDLLAKKDTQIDAKVVAEVFDEYLDEQDVADMIKALISRNADGGAGMDVTARNVGYLLGLADAADFDFKQGEILKPVVDLAKDQLAEQLKTALGETTRLGKSVPLLQTAIGILEALSAEYQRREEQRQQFGDAWADEQVHENFAWIIYLETNGAPESYLDWKNDPAAQQSVSQGDVLSEASEYLDWLEDHGPDSPEYELAQEIRGLQSTIGDAHK